MNNLNSLCAFACVGFLTSVAFFATETNAKSLGWNADALRGELNSVQQLPDAINDIAELKFSDFFVSPVGPRGLTYTDTIKRLDGQRVRILGFMVRQTRPSPGVAMVAAYSFATHEGEYGLCDDLPPATLFIQVPKYSDLAVPFTPGPLLLTGRLEIGPRQETDGRISHVRLLLDPEIVTEVYEPVKTATSTN
ncbi:MAG: hypothetical protein IPP19_14640 [Verrucomicrobia bacterium]|nr:hypothetical protein [Verrucomicrobiota bacterium]